MEGGEREPYKSSSGRRCYLRAHKTDTHPQALGSLKPSPQTRGCFSPPSSSSSSKLCTKATAPTEGTHLNKSWDVSKSTWSHYGKVFLERKKNKAIFLPQHPSAVSNDMFNQFNEKTNIWIQCRREYQPPGDRGDLLIYSSGDGNPLQRPSGWATGLCNVCQAVYIWSSTYWLVLSMPGSWLGPGML